MEVAGVGRGDPRPGARRGASKTGLARGGRPGDGPGPVSIRPHSRRSRHLGTPRDRPPLPRHGPDPAARPIFLPDRGPRVAQPRVALRGAALPGLRRRGPAGVDRSQGRHRAAPARYRLPPPLASGPFPATGRHRHGGRHPLPRALLSHRASPPRHVRVPPRRPPAPPGDGSRRCALALRRSAALRALGEPAPGVPRRAGHAGNLDRRRARAALARERGPRGAGAPVDVDGHPDPVRLRAGHRPQSLGIRSPPIPLAHRDGAATRYHRVATVASRQRSRRHLPAPGGGGGRGLEL